MAPSRTASQATLSPEAEALYQQLQKDFNGRGEQVGKLLVQLKVRRSGMRGHKVPVEG